MTRLIQSLRAWQTAADLLDQAFADFVGINRTDTRCLDIVHQSGPMAAGELARQAGLTTGAVTAVIDRMEKAGLLQRAFDPADRRKVLVDVTPDAERLADEVYGPLAQAGRTHLAALTDEQILTIVAFLDVSRHITVEHAEAVRNRTASKHVPLRYRLEQARMLKDDVKALVKTIRDDMKGMATVVVDLSGTKWARDDEGRWVKQQE